MTTKFWLTSFFLIQLCTVQSQTIIHGTVTNIENSPIPYATVFLSKTSIGVLADKSGVYSLHIPHNGTYEMIASCVGYETRSQIVKVHGIDKLINIRLQEKNVLIKEVTVQGKDRSRPQNYDLFVKCFIGRTANAPFCKIKNQKDLVIFRSSNDSNLIAYSKQSLVIENVSLGYRIIYDLQSFNYNLKTKHLQFSGPYYFQDINKNKRENFRINRNRLIAYYGSRMHFLRALFTDSVSHENFVMLDTRLDSVSNWWLTSNPIKESDLRLKLNPDSMTLYHPRPVEIKYTENHPELFPLPFVYRPGIFTSRMYFTDSAHVYRNGVTDCFDLSWSGNMSFDRIAELLPDDFVPTSKSKKK